MVPVQDSYAAEVDPFFEAAGLSSKTFGVQGRVYEGRFDGRSVKLNVSPRKVTRYAGEVRYRQYVAHQFQFTLGVGPATRFVCGPIEAANSFSRGINRWYGLTQIQLSDPMLAHLECWAIEPDWARRWLAEPNAARSLASLLPPGKRLRAVSLGPFGELGYQCKTGIQDVKKSDLAAWMNALFSLAQAADAVPAPLRRIQPGRLETGLRERPWLAAVVVLLSLMAVVVAITAVLFGVFLLLV